MPIDPRRIEVMDDRVAEILRRKTPGECLRMIDAAWCFMRDLIRSEVQSRHPDWSDHAINQETARRMSNAAH